VSIETMTALLLISAIAALRALGLGSRRLLAGLKEYCRSKQSVRRRSGRRSPHTAVPNAAGYTIYRCRESAGHVHRAAVAAETAFLASFSADPMACFITGSSAQSAGIRWLPGIRHAISVRFIP
jgi:hypothetical protein